MKFLKLFMLLFVTGFMIKNVTAQQLATNANINIGTANAGVVNQGALLDLSISVTNTGANPILANRVRPSISLPTTIGSAAANALQTGLPAGWIITANTGGVITICNGTDVIPAGVTRVAVLKIQGVAIGGPSTIGSTLQFGPGTAVCTGLGTLNGDMPADNISQTSMTVVAAPLPLNLLSFNATLSNCKPSLTWVTESEINSDRFEIERNEISNTNAGWKTVGEVRARGTLAKSTYNYFDKTLDAASVKVFYRLKIMDKDGSYKYSDIIPLSINCKTSQVSVFPNPVKDGKVNVTLSGTTGITQTVLTSAAGQQVLKATLINGTNSLNVSSIADGIYYLHIKEANGTDKKVKLLIQK